MRTTKRILSLVLCFAMIVGMLPMFALNADAATGNVIDAAIFCSDVHGNPDAVTEVFGGIKSGDSTFSPSTASFVGDTDASTGTVTQNAQSVFSGVECYYAYGSHDSGYVTDTTGVLYNGTNYAIYAISQSDMEDYSVAKTASANFASDIAAVATTKPLFIISHMPLHARRGDNNGAGLWCDVINTAAASRDIVFFWAHNHTGETSTDTDAYYLAKGSSITVENDSSNSDSTATASKTLAFTYMNAGYIDANNQNPERKPVATTVKIYSDALVFQDYTSSGAFTGEYSHNVEVAREFASGSTEGGDSGSTDETTTPTEGEDEEATVTYNYTATASTDGTGYILVSNGYALQNNDGTMSAVAVTVSDDGSTITFADTVDVSTLLWTIDSDGKMMNGDYYFLRTSGSGSYITYISTECASDSKFYSWTYADDTLTCASTSSTYYAYYNTDEGAFWTSQGTSQELKFYVPSGTVSGGGSTEGGTDEDDTTTGGSTETVVGDGTYTTADDGSYQKVTFGSSTTEEKTVYVLTDTMTSGKNYLIVDSNSTSGNALINSSNSVSNTTVTITSGSLTIDGTTSTETYIVLDNSNAVWTAGTSGSNGAFKNGSYYLYHKSGNLSLVTSTDNTNWTWDGSNNYLYYSGGGTKYLVYNDGWDISSTADNVYLYEEVTATVTTGSSVTYSVTASDIEHFYTAATDDTETATITASVTEGTPSGTYAYEVVGGDAIITSISEDGVITFNGTEGTAQVKVSYTWTDGDNTYTIWQVIDVTATSPYYDIQLHEAVISYTAVTGEFDDTATYFILNADGEYEKVEITEFADGVTYYTVSATPSAEPIEDTIVLKGKQAGDTYYVWAVVKLYDGTKADGTDQGDVPDSRILWTSSNTNIATVDASTGEITFTGKEYGKFTVTVYYLDEDGKVICEDAVEISVTQTQYVVPEDDTDDDFPEYPREGAIRYDKTATAVGNFSETGIAQVELSMTGVPYTTGSEVDIVLMLDMTGSMETGTLTITDTDGNTSSKTYKEATLDAACAFVESVMTNEDGSLNGNRIGIYVFHVESSSSSGSSKPGEGGSKTGTVEQIWPLDGTDMAKITSLDVLEDIIGESGYIQSANSESGGTHYDVSLEECYNILNTSNTGNKEFCVFMSDGVPTSYAPLESDGTVGDSVEPSESSWWTSSARNSSYQYEYYSTKMKAMGVTVYSVGLGAGDFADMLLNDISGPAYETANDTGSAMTKEDIYFHSIASDGSVDDLENAFTKIALSVKQAATDVVVADQITPQYTMVFDAPNTTVDTADGSQEYYIEVNEWTLDPVYDDDGEIEDYVRDTATSKLKLYLDWSSGSVKALDGNNSKAEFAAPTFGTTAIGTMFYWTTNVDTSSGVQVTVDGTTYYFVPYGISNADEDFNAAVWFNMESGAYASGTQTTETVTVENTDGSTSETTSTTCKDLIIATPLFVYNASTKMIYWTAEKLNSTELALSYFVYLDKSGGWVGAEGETDPGTYPTNVGATITYTNYQDHRCQQEFPVPQMTWKGAQVTYVFYLVNEYGQPVSRSGLRIPFSEAVYVTKEYTHSVVWNEEGGVTALNAAELAEGLVPEVYELYDPKAYYEINVYMDTTSTKDHFIIEGGTAADIVSSIQTNLGKTLTETQVSTSTTKVFNTKADYEHRYSAYGAYSNVAGTYTSDSTKGGSGTEYTVSADNENLITDFDYCNTTVAFAVVWSPSLVPDTVVVDYGLDVVIDVTTNDSMASGVVGVRNDKPADVAINSGNYTPAKAQSAEVKIDDLVIGTATVENLTSVRFSLDKTNGMQFNEAAVFYYESEVNYYTYDSNNNKTMTTTGMYSSVTVIPATTIYYEDEYVELKTYDNPVTVDGTTTYTEHKGWDTDSVEASATQAQDRPGAELITSSPDANNVYGYDAAYSSMSEYSMGSAAMVNVSAGKYATATFTFYGTGFDIISLTSNTTGTIFVKVVAAENITAADGSTIHESGEAAKSLMVDTYYGYTAEYYSVTYTYNAETATWTPGEPEKVVSRGESETAPENPKDGDTYTEFTIKWVVTEEDNALYQVPVIKAEGLAYGKYTVTITASYNSSFDNTGKGSYDFYLDAIRIYDPTGNRDTTSNKAYEADREAYPEYFEVRNQIIDAEKFNALTDDTAISGIVFIDGAIAIPSITDYTSYGPNNETYLAKNQAIAFELNGSYTVPAGKKLDKIQLAVKTVGGTGTVEVYGVKTDGTKVACLDETISTATDMYYDITALEGMTVVIKSTGDAVISITNVKVTYKTSETATAEVASVEETEAPMLFSVRRSTADAALATMNVEEDVPETTVPEETEPETTVPETTAPEEIEPETTVPETTVPEETEPETTEPETTEPETSEPESGVEEIIEEVKKVIKKIFGWLFR